MTDIPTSPFYASGNYVRGPARPSGSGFKETVFALPSEAKARMTAESLNELFAARGAAPIEETCEAAMRDNLMVDELAKAMKIKLAKKREEGYGGWQDADFDRLANLLVGHIAKGDPVDVANFAGMLYVLTEAVGREHMREVLASALSKHVSDVNEATKGLGIRENY